MDEGDIALEEISAKGRPILTDGFVNELTLVPKYIPESVKDPFKLKKDGPQLRSSVDLICDETKYRFTLATRKLIKDPVDFSVVFIYKDLSGRKYIIRRYNGDHGKHFCSDTNSWISGPHIHRITEDAQRIFHKDETVATKTDKYKTLEQAIEFAMDDLNIKYERARGNGDIREW